MRAATARGSEEREFTSLPTTLAKAHAHFIADTAAAAKRLATAARPADGVEKALTEFAKRWMMGRSLGGERAGAGFRPASVPARPMDAADRTFRSP